MRWDDVLLAIEAVLTADSTITEVIPAEDIRLAGPRHFKVPSLEISLISDDVSELWEPCDVQFDIFAPSVAALVAVARALRNDFDLEGVADVGGTRMWSYYLGGAALEGPFLNDSEDVFARALRFRFAPIRERLTKGRS